MGVAARWNRAGAEHAKGIGLDVPPASYEIATSDARDGVGMVRAWLGLQTFVAGRLYVSREFESDVPRARAARRATCGKGLVFGDRKV